MDDQAWKLSSSTQALFSIIVTLWSLTLLYLPRCLFTFIYSLVLAAATAFFLILLRRGMAQKMEPEFQFRTEDQHVEESKPKMEAGFCSISELDHKIDEFDQKPFYADSFLELDVRAPLEVIYEEESENEDEETGNNCLQIQRSLSRYFPETDSDTSSSDEYPDWDSPGKIFFKWDEDDANGLIEISLDSKKAPDFEQEDNMIEIDISPASSSQIPTS